MKIEVLLFAQLKEAYGSGYLSMELPAGAKVSDAVQMVLGKKQLRLLVDCPCATRSMKNSNRPIYF